MRILLPKNLLNPFSIDRIRLRKTAARCFEQFKNMDDVTFCSDLPLSEASIPTPAIGENYEQFARIAWKIQSDDPEGMEELYRIFSQGFRFRFLRAISYQEVDDKIHEAFLHVVRAIRRGDIREPLRLMGFVKTVINREVAKEIRQAVQARRHYDDSKAGSFVADVSQNQQQNVIDRENAKLLERTLWELQDREREVLTRFYLLEQTKDRICAEMSLTPTQFRLLKSKSKAKFGVLGKKRLGRNMLLGFRS